MHPITPPGGHLIPLAVGRTAVAVRGLPDSGVMVQLTRGRAWIAVLSVLLAGIVALNVVSLSLSASQGTVSQQARLLEQENSTLRARIAQRLSNDRVQREAAFLGMGSPVPGDISYRDASGRAPLRLTVQRLAAGFDIGSFLVEAPATTTPTTTATTPTLADVVTAPPPAAPVDPATETLTEPAPAPPTTTQPAPAAPAGTTGGGVSPG